VPAPAYTRNDLVERTLQRLGEVGAGQSAEPEARKIVVDALDGILQELKLDEIYDFADSDEVPGAAMDPLSAIIASRLSDDFNLTADQITLAASREQGAREKLIRYRAQPFVYTPIEVDYF